MTLIVKDSPPPLDDDDPKAHRAREVIAAAQAEDRGSITARMWVYRSITDPINLFDFTVSRHRDGPELFLEGFSGSLMADCYWRLRGGANAERRTDHPRRVRGARAKEGV